MVARGWRFNGQQRPDALHMAVTGPQLQPGIVDSFAADLSAAVEYASTPGLGQPKSAALYGVGCGGGHRGSAARGRFPASSPCSWTRSATEPRRRCNHALPTGSPAGPARDFAGISRR